MGVYKINKETLEKSLKGEVVVAFSNSADILNNREQDWDTLAGIAVGSQDKTLYALFEKLPETYEDFLNETGGEKAITVESGAATMSAAKTTSTTTAK